MPLTNELAYYGVCVTVSAAVSLLVGTWYVLPRLAKRPLPAALTPLLLFSAFRVNGLFFLVAGVASVKDAGHFSCLEKPRQVADLIMGGDRA